MNYYTIIQDKGDIAELFVNGNQDTVTAMIAGLDIDDASDR